ncbi:hypothetical protein [uncultured Neptuniibacter sp.]|uniref:hypothetical protein n=1 Tax=uncultured Neptuniibacter sp. TaxID=502143 RepID=UPI002627D794|nr:hypothetical protein [uncultured Neptuniibacter sp.]
MRAITLDDATIDDAYELLALIYNSAGDEGIELSDVESLINEINVVDRSLKKGERKKVMKVVEDYAHLVPSDLWIKCSAKLRKRRERRALMSKEPKPGRIQVSADTKKKLDKMKRKKRNGVLLYSTYDDVISKLLKSHSKKKSKGKK